MAIGATGSADAIDEGARSATGDDARALGELAAKLRAAK